MAIVGFIWLIFLIEIVYTECGMNIVKDLTRLNSFT